MQLKSNPLHKTLSLPTALGPAAVRKKKINDLMRKRVVRDPKGYTWNMGYNMCSGRYSQGNRYAQFSGSSLNRWKQLKLSYYAKDLQTVTDDFVTMAAKMAGKISAKWGQVPRPLSNCIIRCDKKSADEYRLLLRPVPTGELFGSSLGICRVLSQRSRGKIKDKATAFYRASSGSRTFVTLTFIAEIGDRAACVVLNKFLTVVRKNHSNVQYLWVAERQTTNPDTPDNIHFHLIINKRLPVKRYNALWVLQQYNAGLLGKNKYGEVIGKKEIEARVIDGTVGKVFNPFDVKRVSGIGGLSSYLTKYITKQSKDQPFACSVWHCSRTVSRLFTKTTVSPSAFAYLRSFANYKVDMKTGECFEPEVISGAFWVMIYVNNKAAPLRFLKGMEQVNKWILGGLVLDVLPELDDDLYRKLFLSEN